MIILVENKKKDNSNKLEILVSKLDRLASLVNQLSRTVAILQFSESYLGEGTIEDRRFVEEKIRDIQNIVADLDKINLLFENKDLSAPREKQSHLNRAIVDVGVIRNSMLALWGMRNSGETQEDNKKILDIIKILFTNVNDVLKMLRKYVVDFNEASHIKLRFNIKWTPLPK